MQASRESRFIRASNFAWRALVLIALLVVGALAATAVAGVVVPILLAVLVVPVGRPLYLWLEARMPASLASALVLLIATAVVAAATWLMVASIVANWDALRDGINDAIGSITDWLDRTVSSLSDGRIADIQEKLTEWSSAAFSAMAGGVTSGVSAVGTWVVGYFLFLAFFFFGVRDWDAFKSLLVRFATPANRDEAAAFLDRSDQILRNYWKSQAYIGIFDAVALGLVLAVLGVPLVIPVAILTFVISFVPYLGAFISSALAVFVALGTAGPTEALIVLVASLFIFNAGENLVRPWLVSETVKMSTFVAFLAGVVGVAVAGALGAIVAIPIVAVASEALRAFPENRTPPGPETAGAAADH